MTQLAPSGTLDLGDQQLAYRWIGPGPDSGPTLVLLHEGLGCNEMWGPFPDELAAAMGCGVFVYSRAGYGASGPVPLPRPLTYMHHEALDVLPRVLDAIGFRRGVLIGHSDGASIAALHAGRVQDARVVGISLMAPHFFVEPFTIAEIAKVKTTYESGDLRRRLARYHRDVDVAFYGWNGAWLDPGFSTWDITDCLPRIRVPMQIVQGVDDQYGTREQVEVAQKLGGAGVEAVLLPGIGHWPHREAIRDSREAIADFCERVLKPAG